VGPTRSGWRHWVLALVLAACNSVEQLRAQSTEAVPLGAGDQTVAPQNPDYVAAVDYSRRNGGLSMLVMKGGRVVFEDYAGDPTEAHRLASGTKSFWGVLAAASSADGLLDLDERVSDTLTEWRDDPRRAGITVRQLLSFTSGLDPAEDRLRGNRRRADYFQVVLEVPTIDDSGRSFAYGPSHLMAFGAFLQRRLAARGKSDDPVAYLQERILNPIGVRISEWHRDQQGNPVMPAGAVITAREWAKFGELVNRGGVWNGRRIVDSNRLDEVLVGSEANPAYGLCFWLNRDAVGARSASVADGPMARVERDSGTTSIFPEGPPDLIMAAGAGKQRMYIIPSLDTVIVRQGEGGRGWSDAAFLQLALGIRGGASTTVVPAPKEGRGARGTRAACRADVERLCPDAASNRKNARRCLRRHRDALSPECGAAL